jgi:hypothetical protein
MGRPDGPILVAGGDRDPNLRALVACLERRGEPVFVLRVGESHHPWVTWDLDSGRLVVDGEEITGARHLPSGPARGTRR